MIKTELSQRLSPPALLTLGSLLFPTTVFAGGGHFAMAQLDNAEYAPVFIELATEIGNDSNK